VQLNALFCCLWRNVEAFCHKHFVVFFGNQHRRLQHLPVAALTEAVKPDIGSESRFLPAPPAFDAPVRGVSVGVGYRHPVWCEKLEWRGYPKVKKI